MITSSHLHYVYKSRDQSHSFLEILHLNNLFFQPVGDLPNGSSSTTTTTKKQKQQQQGGTYGCLKSVELEEIRGRCLLLFILHPGGIHQLRGVDGTEILRLNESELASYLDRMQLQR